jgi:hypothetical protein
MVTSAQAVSCLISACRCAQHVACLQVAIITGMVGFTYFSVPLYRIFCAATGYGGTVSQGDTVEAKMKKRIEDPDVAIEECVLTSAAYVCAHEVPLPCVCTVSGALSDTYRRCHKFPSF